MEAALWWLISGAQPISIPQPAGLLAARRAARLAAGQPVRGMWEVGVAAPRIACAVVEALWCWSAVVSLTLPATCRPSWLVGARARPAAGHPVHGRMRKKDPGGLATTCALWLEPRDADEGYGPDAACHPQAFLAVGHVGEAVGQPVRGGL